MFLSSQRHEHFTFNFFHLRFYTRSCVTLLNCFLYSKKHFIPVIQRSTLFQLFKEAAVSDQGGRPAHPKLPAARPLAHFALRSEKFL
jgi:hypothetical protein